MEDETSKHMFTRRPYTELARSREKNTLVTKFYIHIFDTFTFITVWFVHTVKSREMWKLS